MWDKTGPGVGGWREELGRQQGCDALEMCVKVCGGLFQAAREPHGQNGSLVQLLGLSPGGVDSLLYSMTVRLFHLYTKACFLKIWSDFVVRLNQSSFLNFYLLFLFCQQILCKIISFIVPFSCVCVIILCCHSLPSSTAPSHTLCPSLWLPFHVFP